MTHDGESSCIEICEQTVRVTQGEKKNNRVYKSYQMNQSLYPRFKIDYIRDITSGERAG